MKSVIRYLSLSYKKIGMKADYIFIVIVGFVSSLPVLKTFFYADDFHHLYINNPQMNGFVGWNPFAMQAQSLSNYNLYRPTTNLYFLISEKLFGLDAFGFHVIQLCIFLFTICLIYYFALQLTQKKIVALVASLFFIFFPARVEPSQWPAAIADTFLVFFSLVALIFFLKAVYRKSCDKMFFIQAFLSGGFFSLALISKEPAVVLLPAVALFLIIFKKINKKNLLLLAITSIPLLPYIKMRLLYQQKLVSTPGYKMPFTDTSSYNTYVLNLKYFALRTFGMPFTPEQTKISVIFVSLSVVFLLSFAFFLYQKKKDSKNISILLFIWLSSFYLFAIIPTINVPNYFDRYLYLGSIPLSILVGVFAAEIVKIRLGRTLAYTFVIFTLFFFGLQTVEKEVQEYEGSIIAKKYIGSLSPLVQEDVVRLVNVPFYYDKMNLRFWRERTLVVNQTRYIFNLFYGKDVKTEDSVIAVFYNKNPRFDYQILNGLVNLETTDEGLSINPIYPDSGSLIVDEYKKFGIKGKITFRIPENYYIYKDGKQIKEKIGQ